MYTYNRKYIEQQIIGPHLVLNTVVFLFITISMVMISQKSMVISDNIFHNASSSTFFSRIFEKPSPAQPSILFNSDMIGQQYCRSIENTVLSTIVPSYGMCQAYVHDGAKHSVNAAADLLDPEAFQLFFDKNDLHRLSSHSCTPAPFGRFDYTSQLSPILLFNRNLSPYEKKAMPFHPIIYQVAQRYEVEPAIIKAIIMAESSFNPKAVSHKGAQGLMQLMPRTAKYMGVKDSFNPEHNIDGGVKYFKLLLDRFDGDIRLALAAYNAGSRNVRKYNGVPPFKATKLYIKKVLKYYEEYKTT